MTFHGHRRLAIARAGRALRRAVRLRGHVRRTSLPLLAARVSGRRSVGQHRARRHRRAFWARERDVGPLAQHVAQYRLPVQNGQPQVHLRFGAFFLSFQLLLFHQL